MRYKAYSLPALAGALMAISGCSTSLMEPEMMSEETRAHVASVLTSQEQGITLQRWRNLVVSPELSTLVDLAMDRNHDLQDAILNVDRSAAMYRVSQSNQLPSVSAQMSGSRGVTGSSDAISEQRTLSVNLDAFELDFWGRVSSLSEASLQEYLSSEAGANETAIVVASSVAKEYLALAKSQAMLGLSRNTLDNRLNALDLSEKRYSLGDISELDVSQERASAEQARKDVARYQQEISSSINALEVLVGTALSEVQAEGGLSDGVWWGNISAKQLYDIPAIRAAEHTLKAQRANLEAARAAYLPSVTLTSSIGRLTPSLEGSLSSGVSQWGISPSINVPIFNHGRLKAEERRAEAEQAMALNAYEKSIFESIRAIKDATSAISSLKERAAIQERVLNASERSHALAAARYENGADSYLRLLDAERTLYSDQQDMISLEYDVERAKVDLLAALGVRY